ncbi:MAG: Na+/H+ antiporter subunit E [Gammaproteobacteria bacterium]|nr:Na+/H+ antiporter subunit E [Gammaproteobacteria bacterium]
MKEHFRLLAILLGLWLLLSGYFIPLILGLGAVSCLLVWWLSKRMDESDAFGHNGDLRFFASLRYLAWLTVEVVKSNFDVARRVLSPELPISPTIVWVPASQSTDLGRVIYANSITLTPGTISINLENDEIEVHALTREGAEALVGGEMDRRVCGIERAG